MTDTQQQPYLSGGSVYGNERLLGVSLEISPSLMLAIRRYHKDEKTRFFIHTPTSIRPIGTARADNVLKALHSLARSFAARPDVPTSLHISKNDYAEAFF